ncbi:DotA/TraY family protein [Burkholderia cepacia]|uniref:DotA/TraY family protein n=1 Tax=Burkholderia cepacia TaxID=292 RepID=UPI001589A65B|nr:DotA/TraY family protein [Burkholderia cepacia]
MRNKILLFFFLTLCSTGFAANVFEPVVQDKSMLVLSALFGGLMENGGGDPLLAGIKALNGCVLIIGGILAAYTIFAGTMMSAHDGELLGKKFSSVWIPIRYSMGTALILPIVGGGYCVIQALVMWIIIQGVGLADNVWSALMTPDAIQKWASASITPPSAKQLAYGIFGNLSCLHAHDKLMKEELASPHGNLLGVAGSSFGVSVEQGILGTTFNFGDKNEHGHFEANSCGYVLVPKYSMPAIKQASSPITQIFNGQEAVNNMIKVNQLNVQYVQQLIQEIDPIAQQQVNAKGAIDLSGVEKAANNYENNLMNSSTTIVLGNFGNDELSKSATNDGWVMAGTFFNKIIDLQDTAQRTASDIPNAVNPKTVDTTIWKEQFENIMAYTQQSLNKAGASYSLEFANGDQIGGTNNSLWSTVKDAVLHGLDINIIVKGITAKFTKFAINDHENPYLSSERMGGWIFGSAVILQVGLLIANASPAGLSPGIAQDIGHILNFVVPLMYVSGGLLKFILPNLPFLIWIGAVMGWIVLCFEAVVAAPLWMAMHLYPEGHDMVGGGKAGYRLILSLLLRPVLMILGFMASIVISSVFGGFVNYIFADQWIASQTQDNVFLFLIGTFVFQPLIYFGLMITICKKSSELIYLVPDQLLRWLGSATESLGSFARAMSSGEAVAGGMAVGRMLGNGSSEMGKGLGKALAERKLNNSSNDPQDRINSSRNNFVNKAVSQSVGENESEENKSLAQQKFDNQFNGAMEFFGGAESSEGQKFAEDLNNRIETDPSKTASKHMDTMLNKAISAKYGYGSGQIVGNIGEGYSGEKFKGALSMYEGAFKNLSENGMKDNDIQKNMEKANRQSWSDFKNSKESVKNGGKLELQDFAKHNIEQISGGFNE